MESLRRISTLLSFGMAVIAADLLAAIPRSDDTSPPDQAETGIDIWVYNCAEAPEGDLKRARRVASEIFRVIGVKTVWHEVPGTERRLRRRATDQNLPGTSDLIVRILPGPMAAVSDADLRAGALTRGGRSLGSTVSSDEAPSIVNASLDRLERMAEKEGLLESLPELLGCVMAHEIGHVLLGPGSYSAQGIMLRHWGPEELRLASRGRLRFTAEQAKIVRAAVRSRNQRREPLQAEATTPGGR